jgi:TPR repeat protein
MANLETLMNLKKHTLDEEPDSTPAPKRQKMDHQQQKGESESDLWVRIGDCYYEEKKFKEAVELYTKSANQNNSNGQYKLGLCFFRNVGVDQQDKKQAFELFFKSANQGNMYGQNWTGFCLQTGSGVEKDEKQAIEWYVKSANQDCSLGQYNLGYCYDYGIGIEKDKKKAFEWILKAANQNFDEAQSDIGYYYDREEGVAVEKNHQNQQKAFDWYLKSANQGYSVAQYNLAEWYYERKEFKEAIKWFEKSANQNMMCAQFELGRCFFDGIGCIKDKEKGIDMILKSANQNHVKSQVFLADYYEDMKAYEQSFAWYQKLALLNHAQSMCHLGACYVNGEGVEQDYSIAMEWYLKSAELGVTSAMNNIAELYRLGSGVKKDILKSMEWNLRSAAKNDAKAQRSVANLLFGNLINKKYTNEEIILDKCLAIEWYNKAAENNDRKSQVLLSQILLCNDVCKNNVDFNVDINCLLNKTKATIYKIPKTTTITTTTTTTTIQDFAKSLYWISLACEQKNNTQETIKDSLDKWLSNLPKNELLLYIQLLQHLIAFYIDHNDILDFLLKRLSEFEKKKKTTLYKLQNIQLQKTNNFAIRQVLSHFVVVTELGNLIASYV